MHLLGLLSMHHSAVPFPFQGMLPLSPSFSNIHTTSVCLKSLPVLYFPPHSILSVYTFHTPHTILSPPLYTTPAPTGMPHLVLSLSLDDSRTTWCECLGRTRWSSLLDWTTYLYYFYKWLYPTSPWSYVLLEYSTITWPCHVIWLLKFPCYLYLVCIVWLDICN